MDLPEADWTHLVPILEGLEREPADLLDKLAALPTAARFASELVGDHVESLVERGILLATTNVERLAHTEVSRSLRVVLRAAKSCRVLDAGDDASEAVRDYLGMNFTAAQRAVVLHVDEYKAHRVLQAQVRHVCSSAWIAEFLSLQDPLRFDFQRARRSYPREMNQEFHTALCEVIDLACIAPVGLEHLNRRIDPALVGPAIEMGIRYLVLFPRIADGAFEVGLVPSLAARLNTTPQATPDVVDMPSPTPVPFLVQDAVAIYVHACGKPIRVKAAGFEIYQRDMDQLIEALTFVDLRLDPFARVTRAVDALLGIGAIEHASSAAVKRGLVPTEVGAQWIIGSEIERLEPIAARVTAGISDSRVAQFFGPYALYYASAEECGRIWKSLVAIFDALPREGVVPMEEFLRFQCPRNNPFEEGSRRGKVPLEVMWEPAAEEFLCWLASVGGAVLVQTDDAILCGRAEMGDYVLGLREDRPKLASESGRVIVQPNFDIVFLSPMPAAEASFVRFCEREGSDSVGTLFRITRESVMRAAVAGLTLEDVREALEVHAEHLPANVITQLSGWFDGVRAVKATSGIVIQCPDEPTADRLEGASGKTVVRIAPTMLLATDRKAFDRVVSKLQSQGIVFTVDLSADPVPKKKAARRRRSRRRDW